MKIEREKARNALRKHRIRSCLSHGSQMQTKGRIKHLSSDLGSPNLSRDLYVKVAVKLLNHAFLLAFCVYLSLNNLSFILSPYSYVFLTPNWVFFKFYESPKSISLTLNSFMMSIFMFPASREKSPLEHSINTSK